MPAALIARCMMALAVGALVGACGPSDLGKCGDANQECCRDEANGFGLFCNVGPDLPNPKALTCQRFTNGAYDCLPCGYDGEACCVDANGNECVSGLTCVAPYPNATTGGVCRRSP
jgi:hypothetical protein